MPDSTMTGGLPVDAQSLDLLIQGALGIATWLVTAGLRQLTIFSLVEKWVDVTYVVSGVAIVVGLVGSYIAGYPVGTTAMTIVTAILAQRTFKHVPRVIDNLKQ